MTDIKPKAREVAALRKWVQVRETFCRNIRMGEATYNGVGALSDFYKMTRDTCRAVGFEDLSHALSDIKAHADDEAKRYPNQRFGQYRGEIKLYEEAHHLLPDAVHSLSVKADDLGLSRKDKSAEFEKFLREVVKCQRVHHRL